MTGPTLHIYRGLPASGKTTAAKAVIGKAIAGGNAKLVRVNRDELRDQLFGGHGGHGTNEQAITAASHAAIRALLEQGVSVICDDTNLRLRYLRDLVQLAHGCSADVRLVQQFLAVPLEECLRRDEARPARVGADVIRDLHARFIAGKKNPEFSLTAVQRVAAAAGIPRPVPYTVPAGAPTAVLVDIDGTLATLGDRGPYDWERVGEDTLNRAVAETVSALWLAGHHVIVMSGRDSVCRPQTEAWLAGHKVRHDDLHMRALGDVRKDSVVKAELFDQHVRDRYDVVTVLDDRDQVVKLWRDLGLACFQVAPGNF